MKPDGIKDGGRPRLDDDTKHTYLHEEKTSRGAGNTAGHSTTPASASPILNLTDQACLTHLKLLEAFSMLRSDISSQDGAFGIYDNTDSFQVGYGASQDARAAIEQKRWSIFVTKAVLRFTKWWQSVLQPDSTMTTIAKLANDKTGEVFLQSPPISFDGPTNNPAKLGLPPLDVLMVWHAFMLNPRNYMNDCIRFGKLGAWNACMPWTAIDEAVDHHTFAYVVGGDVQARWTAATGLAWHVDTADTMTEVTCASCKRGFDVPWTTQSWSTSYAPSDAASGFSDPSFQARCACGFTMTHKAYRVFHFARDLEHLLDRDVPMPGTILSSRGKLPDAGARSSLQSSDLLKPSPSKSRSLGIDFPNVIFQIGYGEDILEQIDNWMRQGSEAGSFSMTDVKNQIESAIQDKLGYHAQLDGSTSVRRSKPAFVTQQDGRLSIRRMMSTYWDNGSIFSLDLVGAVIRQGDFVNKMHEINWLHSPSALSTMNRLLQRYERFFDIMGHSEDNIAVPTLDIDLAWHTHQLSPRDYYDYSVKHTYPTVFIDHDDKIEETKLSDAFVWTSKTYWERYGEMYSECTCWYCETVYESHRPSGLTGHVFKRSEKKHFDKVKETISSQSTETGHISAHSVFASDSAFYKRIKKDVHEAWLQEYYKRAQRRAAKKERKEAKRNADQPRRNRDRTSKTSNIYLTSATAYPYSVTPVPAGVYICDPNCNVEGTGVAGACCNVTGMCGTGGSCAGGAGGGGAFGSCASSTTGCGASLGGCCGVGGSGGCGAGSGGGCAGGGGGGGCGGCGGGGGGGCGGGGGGGGC